MSNHPFLAFLPPNWRQLVSFYFPNIAPPPPHHICWGVSSCLMLDAFHSIVRLLAISHLATLPVRGRHLCGHKSPCFGSEGGREGGRAVSGLSDATPRGRPATPSALPARERASFEAKRKSMVGAAGCLFETFCMLTVSLHLRLDFKNRKPPQLGAGVYMVIQSSFIIRNKLKPRFEPHCGVADKGEANWRQRFSNHLLSRGIDAFARARARALRDNCKNTIFKFPLTFSANAEKYDLHTTRSFRSTGTSAVRTVRRTRSNAATAKITLSSSVASLSVSHQGA